MITLNIYIYISYHVFALRKNGRAKSDREGRQERLYIFGVWCGAHRQAGRPAGPPASLFIFFIYAFPSQSVRFSKQTHYKFQILPNSDSFVDFLP